MSQLFDSLRRHGRPAPPRSAPLRSGKAEAVLATLGYSTVRRRGAVSALGGPIALLAVAALGWYAWTTYSEPPADDPRRDAAHPPAPAAPTPPPVAVPRGDFADALKHYTAVVEQEPMNAQARNNLGMLFQEHGRPGEAIREFQRALTIDPRNALAHYNLGVLYDETGEAALAMQHYRSFLDYATVENARRAAAVRGRLDVMSRVR